MIDLEKRFIGIGGEFLSPPSVLKNKVSRIKAIIFDWDGVFNDGVKDTNYSSSFSEGDAMGTNLMRFSFYLSRGEIPVTSIFTGALNDIAQHLAKREHFDYLVFKCINKGAAFEDFLNQNSLSPEEVAFCFDDVLDLPIAEKCGLRFYVNSVGRPMFEDYLLRHNLYDYKTGSKGGENAVREIAELLIGLLGNYDDVVKHRLAFTDTYQKYWDQRNSVSTQIIKWKTTDH